MSRPSASLLALAAAACVTLAPSPASPPLIPDPRLTPGAVLPVTAQEVCVPGYSRQVRNVPQALKEAVYREYGIASHARGEFEIDHCVSLELGGSNDLANLWPESFRTEPWNAHVKDRLENLLHARVCSGQETLAQAQAEIRGDWRVAYRKYLGEPR